jgi:NDP-sugar pyrophosphorylase family protein
MPDFGLFRLTLNNVPDLLSVSQDFNVKESNIALLKGDLENIDIADGVVIQKCVIGRNVKIGHKTKISNSVILGNVKIGSEVIIQNSLICNKCVIGEK